ncbi:hypothetical protein AAFN90_00020 [Erwiniaceae bacterium CAU 1747]
MEIPLPVPALDRHYGYDAAQNLVSVNDDAERLSYVVNGNHQVVSVSSGRTLREFYRYDACGYPAQGDSVTGQAVGHDDIYRRGHRLNRLGRHGYEYDAAGRMTARRLERDGYRPEYTRFVWNTQNQLVALQERWRERPEWQTYFAVSASTGQPLALFNPTVTVPGGCRAVSMRGEARWSGTMTRAAGW